MRKNTNEWRTTKKGRGGEGMCVGKALGRINKNKYRNVFEVSQRVEKQTDASED